MAHERITPSDVTPTRTYKLIGMLHQENASKKVAIFSSETERPLYASEGQTVLGQFKVLSVNGKPRVVP